MSVHGPHEWTGDGYNCATCGGSYHCAKCSDSSSMQGHYVKDADGWYFGCQEPERWERQRVAMWQR